MCSKDFKCFGWFMIHFQRAAQTKHMRQVCTSWLPWYKQKILDMLCPITYIKLWKIPSSKDQEIPALGSEGMYRYRCREKWFTPQSYFRFFWCSGFKTSYLSRSHKPRSTWSGLMFLVSGVPWTWATSCILYFEHVSCILMYDTHVKYIFFKHPSSVNCNLLQI